jgi:hypothetical protein
MPVKKALYALTTPVEGVTLSRCEGNVKPHLGWRLRGSGKERGLDKLGVY